LNTAKDLDHGFARRNTLNGVSLPLKPAKKHVSGKHQTQKMLSSDNHSNSSSEKSEEGKNQIEKTVEGLISKMAELKTSIAKYALSQQGSKYLQRVLTKASADVIDFIIKEVSSNLPSLMTGAYGNYFCQKLIQSSSSNQRLQILKEISPAIVEISCEKKGTHVIQCLVQMVNMEEEIQLLEEILADRVLDLSFDLHGTHVVQCAVTTLEISKIGYIFDACYDYLIDLAVNANGLCIVKKIIAKFSKSPLHRALLVKTFSENCLQLVQDPYGNYAMQKVIDAWTNDELNEIYIRLYKNLVQLAMQKFSSNVIERCLEKADYAVLSKSEPGRLC